MSAKVNVLLLNMLRLCAPILVAYGIYVAHFYGWAGHAIILIGLLVGAFAQVSRPDEPLLDEPSSPSTPRWKILACGFLLLGSSIATSTGPEHTLTTVILWILGLVFLIPEMSRQSQKIAKDSGSSEDQTFWIYAVVLIVLSASLNIWRLHDFAYTIHGDEGEIFEIAQTSNLSTALFRPSAWWGMPTLDLAPIRVGNLVTDHLIGVRLCGALFGILANLCIFLFLSRISRAPTAFLSSLLVMTDPNLLHTYRCGLNICPPIFLTIALFYFVYSWISLQKPNIASGVTFGVLLGLACLLYISARSLVIYFAALMLLGLVFPRLLKKTRRDIFITGSVSLVILLLVAGPLLIYYFFFPEAAFPRSNYINDFIAWLREPGGDTVLQKLTIQYGRLLSAPYLSSDTFIGDFYFIEGGFLACVPAAFLLLGIIPKWLGKGRSLYWALWISLIVCLVALGGFTVASPRYHRLTVPFAVATLLSAVVFAQWWESIRWKAAQVALIPVVLCISVWQVSVYIDSVSPIHEYAITSKARMARELVAELQRGTAPVYCVTWPVYECRNGTFRILMPDLNSKSFTEQQFIEALNTMNLREGIFIFFSSGVQSMQALKSKIPSNVEVQERAIHFFPPREGVDSWIVRLHEKST